LLANPDFLHVCRETQFLRESHGLVSTIAKYGRSLGDGTGPDFKCILGIELLLGELAGGKRLEIRHTASSLLPGARLAVQDLGDGVLFHEHHGKPERLGNLLDRCEPRVPLAGLERLDHPERARGVVAAIGSRRQLKCPGLDCGFQVLAPLRIRCL
jgi:hypothetical protein